VIRARVSLGAVSLLLLGFAACDGGNDNGTPTTGGKGGHGGSVAGKGGSTGGTHTGHGDAGSSGESDVHDGHGATGGSSGAHDGHDATGGEGDHEGHESTGGSDTHSSGGSDHHTATGGSSAMGGSSHASHDGGMSGMSDMGGTGGSMAMGGSTMIGMSGEGGEAGAHGGENSMPMGGSSGVGGSGMGAMSGMGGEAGADGMPEHDHCLYGEPADPRDALLATPSTPDIFTASNGDIDLPLPKQVLAWMDQRIWKASHDAWHNIRRCRGGTGGGEGEASSSAKMCAHTELVPEHQECKDATNGFEFLVMHRHMLIALRQAFPTHADFFSGFPHFPFAATDVPAEWQSRFGSGWSNNVIATATKLEDIENHLNEFATEGDLGKYIQCGMSGVTSIHGAMHFKWVVNESPNNLGKQSVNLGNYMFWKLHGWIDGIWERYRVAKGLAPDEQHLKDALVDQCREMHTLGDVIVAEGGDGGGDGGPLPVEHGYFHEKVRPAFERLCVGCHSETSPEANQSLAGKISSADIVKNLVNVKTSDGGDFFRIVPFHPEESWTYLKPAGLAETAGCVGDTCNTQSMPPGATPDQGMTTEELGFLQQWILDGAPEPTHD